MFPRNITLHCKKGGTLCTLRFRELWPPRLPTATQYTSTVRLRELPINNSGDPTRAPPDRNKTTLKCRVSKLLDYGGRCRNLNRIVLPAPPLLTLPWSFERRVLKPMRNMGCDFGGSTPCARKLVSLRRGGGSGKLTSRAGQSMLFLY